MALGNLATDAIEAEIQQNVGAFLQMKSYLVKMRASKVPSEQTKANELFEQQVVMEKRLNKALAEIETIKKGAYTFSGIRKLSSFISDLRSHMATVNAFLAGKPLPEIEIIPYKKPILAGLFLLGLLWWTRR